MFHIGIEAAKLTLAFRPAFAQRGDGARLDDLEKVKSCRAADVPALFGVEPFEARLHSATFVLASARLRSQPGGCDCVAHRSGGRRSTEVQRRADLPPRRRSVCSLGRSARDCKRDEEDAHSKLQQDWAQYSPAQRAGCVRFSSLGSSPRYVELLTSLEIAKQAKQLPEASKMGTSGQR